MTDVAALAGVSHQTVSRVINNHPHVSVATRTRVEQAIGALGYRPNRTAKALATGRSQLLGVIAQTSSLYGPVSLLASFEQASAQAGYAVSVASVVALTPEALAAAVNRQLDQDVAAIVVIAPVASAQRALAGVPVEVPLVVIDGDPASGAQTVTVDQAEGARLATQHLLDAGHRNVWHVAGPPGWFDSVGRIAGWRRTLVKAGIKPPPLLRGDWSAASGYQAGLKLAAMPEVTAVFAANDHLALGVLRALAENDRAVPADVSLVGFDDVPEAAYYATALTTIRPDFGTVGLRALELLLDKLDRQSTSTQHAAIAPTLISRASVAAPPPRAVTARRGTPRR